METQKSIEENNVPASAKDAPGRDYVNRLVSRLCCFFSLVWRPFTSDRGDTWIAAWIKYRISPATAWKVSGILCD